MRVGICTVSTSATTLVSFRNTQVFRMALTALKEPRTLWWRITNFLSLRWKVVLHTNLFYFVPRMWWRIHTIRMTRVLHSSQELQLCCSHWHNAWQCLWLAPAKCHNFTFPLSLYIGCRTLPSMISFEMLSHITIQSSLGIHCSPLHLLCNYCNLQVWNILSNLSTL